MKSPAFAGLFLFEFISDIAVGILHGGFRGFIQQVLEARIQCRL